MLGSQHTRRQNSAQRFFPRGDVSGSGGNDDEDGGSERDEEDIDNENGNNVGNVNDKERESGMSQGVGV